MDALPSSGGIPHALVERGSQTVPNPSVQPAEYLGSTCLLRRINTFISKGSGIQWMPRPVFGRHFEHRVKVLQLYRKQRIGHLFKDVMHLSFKDFERLEREIRSIKQPVKVVKKVRSLPDLSSEILTEEGEVLSQDVYPTSIPVRSPVNPPRVVTRKKHTWSTGVGRHLITEKVIKPPRPVTRPPLATPRVTLVRPKRSQPLTSEKPDVQVEWEATHPTEVVKTRLLETENRLVPPKPKRKLIDANTPISEIPERLSMIRSLKAKLELVSKQVVPPDPTITEYIGGLATGYREFLRTLPKDEVNIIVTKKFKIELSRLKTLRQKRADTIAEIQRGIESSIEGSDFGSFDPEFLGVLRNHSVDWTVDELRSNWKYITSEDEMEKQTQFESENKDSRLVSFLMEGGTDIDSFTPALQQIDSYENVTHQQLVGDYQRQKLLE
jgi:hypothetical protein